MFIYQTKVKLHDTDAAGVLFFANQFKMVHDAYEAMLESIGYGFDEIIRNKDYFFPIVRAEGDYRSPLRVGDQIEIQVKIEKLGQTSIIFSYTLLNPKQQVVGTARTVHVGVNKKTYQKIPIPPDLRAKLEKLHKQDNPK